MLTLLRRAFALVLVANMAFVTTAPPALARMTYDTSNLTVGLPAGVAGTDGTLSIPAGAAPAGSTVTFYVEGLAVGTATAASNGSATLTKPLYPPGAGAAFQYGALKTSPAVKAPGSTIPAYTTYSNLLSNSTDVAGWTLTSGTTLTKPDSTSLQLQTTVTGTGSGTALQYLSEYVTSLPAGTYTLGVTGLMTAGDPSTTSLGLRFFDPQYAQNSANPTIALNTPFRVSLTFTVSGNRNQSIAVVGNKLDGSSSPATFKLYNLVLAGGSADPFAPAADGSLAAPQAVPKTDPSVDYAGQFITTMTYPTQLPPAIPGDLPAGNLRLESGAQNLVSMTFTPDGNVNTRALLDSMTFPTAITGNLTNPIGDGGTAPNYSAVDGAQATKTFGRYRRYPPGHPYDNQVFTPDGLKLGVVGARNNQKPFVGPAVGTDTQVYAAGFRTETPVLPGYYWERTARFGTNPLSWNCLWAFVGVQISPNRYAIAKNDPSTINAPYAKGNNQPGALLYIAKDVGNGLDPTKGPYYEIDDHDAWWEKRYGSYLQGAPAGFVRQGTQSPGQKITPYTYFLPADNGFSYGGLTDGSEQRLARFTNSLADGQFHTIGVNWIDKGTYTILQFIADGKLFMEQYLEYNIDSYTDPITGTTQKIGMHLLTGGQSIPGFILNGYTDQDPFKKNPVDPGDIDALALTIKTLKIWKGNLDQTTIIKPTNALTTKFTALATTSPLTGVINTAGTVTVTGTQSSGTKLTAAAYSDAARTIPDGVVTVSGNDVTSTFTTAGTKYLSVIEHPYVTADSGSGLGVPRTTNFTLAISATPPVVTLNTLAFTPTTINVGNPYAGSVATTASGSTVAVTSSEGSAFTASGTGTSRSVAGLFATGGAQSLTSVETLSGATNTPKSSTTNITVNADNPTGSNLVTDQVIGGATWAIGSAGGSPSLTVTQGQPDVTGGSTAQLVVPTTASGLHRFSKTFTALNAGAQYETYAIVKRNGTGAGSRYLLIGNSNTWGKAVCDLQPTFPVCKVDPTYTPSGGYFVTPLANGYFKMGVRGNIPSGVTSQSMFVEFVNGYNTDDAVTGVGTFSGDGTSGLYIAQTYFGAP